MSESKDAVKMACVRFRQAFPGAKLPRLPQHPGDSCWDLYNQERVRLAPFAVTPIATGTQVTFPEAPEGYVFALNIHPRSGLSIKYSCWPLAGVVDEGYEGEIIVAMYNGSNEWKEIPAYSRCAQAQLVLCYRPEVSGSDMREKKGFGSTGYD